MFGCSPSALCSWQGWFESQLYHFLADDLGKVYKMGMMMLSPPSQRYWEASDESHLRPQQTAATAVVAQYFICFNTYLSSTCSVSGSVLAPGGKGGNKRVRALALRLGAHSKPINN